MRFILRRQKARDRPWPGVQPGDDARPTRGAEEQTLAQRFRGVKIAFTPHRWADYSGWVGDRKTLTRMNRLITAAARDPGSGTGKPTASPAT